VKRTLIIRSVSLQQLDRCWPDEEQRKATMGAVDLLTHEHAVGPCLELPGINQVIPVAHQGSFSPFRKPPSLETYDNILIPVANYSGAGFTNVVLYSLRLSGTNRMLWTLDNRFIPLTPGHLTRLLLRWCSGHFLAALGLVLTAIPLWIVLYYFLRRQESHHEST
jgi:hypothetical protein